MIDYIGIQKDLVPELRQKYYKQYGTTMRGLQKHHQINVDEYLDYVHDLPLNDYLEPNPELRVMLDSLPQRCWIFTNADHHHAKRVLTTLGILDCFLGIIDVWAIDFACKPEMVSFQRALKIADNPNPAQCVMIDDSILNIIAASSLEMKTVLVNRNGVSHPAAENTIHNLLEMPKAIPQLWD